MKGFVRNPEVILETTEDISENPGKNLERNPWRIFWNNPRKAF